MRTLIYLILVPLAGVVLWKIGMHRLEANVRDCSAHAPRDQGLLHATQEALICVETRSGALARWVYRKEAAAVLALPNVPCRYVGNWLSARPHTLYRITLKDDGNFEAERLKDMHVVKVKPTGVWGEHDGSLVWLYDQIAPWPPDVNQIINPTPTSFTLVEFNGTHTYFTLETRGAQDHCTGPAGGS